MTSSQILGRLLCEVSSTSTGGKETSAQLEEKSSILLAQQQRQQDNHLSPVTRCLLAEYNIDDASAIKGTGVGGRITREDIEKYLANIPPTIEEQKTHLIAQSTLCSSREKRVINRRLYAKRSSNPGDA